MVKRVLKWFLGIVLVLLLVVAVFAVNAIWFRPWSLNVFYEKVFVEVLFHEPELLSSLGLVEQFGITGHNAKAGRRIAGASAEAASSGCGQNLAQLHAYPLEKQNASQRLSTAVLDWFLTVQVEGEKYQWHNYPVNQLFGVQNQFPSFMANTHRLLGPRDCEYYVKRLQALPTKFDQLLEGLQVREEKKIIPPRFVVERVLKEMTEFVAQPPAENILATSFKKRVAKIDKLTERAALRFPGASGRRDQPSGLSRLPKVDRLLHRAPAHHDDRRWRLEIAGWRGLLRLHAAPEHDHEAEPGGDSRARRGAKWRGSKARCAPFWMRTVSPVSRSRRRWMRWAKIRVFFLPTTTPAAPLRWRNTRA